MSHKLAIWYFYILILPTFAASENRHALHLILCVYSFIQTKETNIKQYVNK